MNEIISRADAKAAGMNHYFTGKPCKNEHVAPRYVSTVHCVECKRAHITGMDQEGIAKKRAKESDWRAKNQAYVKETSRAWYEANKENIAAVNATPSGKAYQLFNSGRCRARQKSLPFDITQEIVLELLEEALSLGIVTCEAERPDTASIDQIVAGAGYTKTNVQIVPFWYNLAKLDFDAVDLHAAMRQWQLVYG